MSQFACEKITLSWRVSEKTWFLFICWKYVLFSDPLIWLGLFSKKIFNKPLNDLPEQHVVAPSQSLIHLLEAILNFPIFITSSKIDPSFIWITWVSFPKKIKISAIVARTWICLGLLLTNLSLNSSYFSNKGNYFNDTYVVFILGVIKTSSEYNLYPISSSP